MVECGDPSGAHALSDGDDGSVDESEIETPLRLDEVNGAGIVRLQQVHNFERSVKDRIEEVHLVLRSESAAEHPACFRDDWSRNDEALFGAQEIAARLMVRFALTARFKQNARVDNQHGGSVAAE